MKTLAPIVIFAYRRPLHLEQLILSLSTNKEWKISKIIFYVDGPKSTEDALNVKEVIAYINSLNHPNSELKVSSVNLGLSKSIIKGVTETLEKYESVIVLEDDLIVGSQFLEFMNHGLTTLKNEKNVCSIQGFTSLNDEKISQTYYQLGADCWGWATWRDRWKLLELNGSKLAHELSERKLIRTFNMDFSYPYYELLKRQIEGKNDSWAIRWHASMFLQDKLSLYPPYSLVSNSGMDGSGTHSSVTDKYEVQLPNFEKIKYAFYPIQQNNLVLKLLVKQNQKRFHVYKKYTLRWMYWGLRRRIESIFRRKTGLIKSE